MMETNKKTEKSMLRAKKAHWTGIMRKAIACFINSYDESIGRYFKVFAEDGTLAACLFITGSGTVSTSLPGGIYKIMDATGDTWYGTSEAFGPDGYYEYMVFDEVEGDRYLTILDAGYEWTISVNVTENTGGTGVGSESFDWDSWTAN